MKYYRIIGPTTVDISAVRAHLIMLREAGITKSQVCELTGLGIATVGRIINGRNTRGVVMKDTADKILSIKVSDAIPKGFFDITVYRRKLQALIAIGWSKKALSELLGVGESNVNEIVSKRRKFILAETARNVDELYEKISMKIGPCEKSKQIARNNCWLPPLAWDDIENINEKVPSYRSVVHDSLIRNRKTPKKSDKQIQEIKVAV